MRDEGWDPMDTNLPADVTLAPKGIHRRPLGGVFSALLNDNRVRSNAAEASPKQPTLPTVILALAPFRFAIPEAAMVLRLSRAQLYSRIRNGAIKTHKDGGRTYISRSELKRYVKSCR